MLLKCLADISNNDTFVFNCFHETKKSNLPYSFRGTLEHYKEEFETLNKKGYGIYFTVNSPRGAVRKNTEIIQFRAIFQDDDKNYQGDYPLPPSYVIQSSEHKYQRYWLIDQSTIPSLDIMRVEWKQVQGNMVKWGNDKSVHDPARVLRVPGFFNTKAEPFLVEEIDTNGKLYSWQELKDAFEPKVESKEVAKKEQSRGLHLAAAMDAIVTGENFNNSITTLTQHFANQGYGADMIETLIKGLMQACVTKDERWQKRIDHLPKYITTALEKAQELSDNTLIESLEDKVEEEVNLISIPWPPGMLGEMSKVAFNAQQYQNQTVAVVSAVGVVAGIAGRKFNVSNTGLNLYLTVLMQSGAGKDAIAKFAQHFLGAFNELGQALQFLGPKRYTGPAALIKALKEQRTLLSVFTEAGYMFKSSAGDQEGLIRAVLDLYTKSGCMDYSGSEMYSSVDNSIPMLRAPSLTIINEATPITLLEVLSNRNAASTGELARMNIFRIGDKKPYFNHGNNFSISSELHNTFSLLLKLCLKSAKQDDPEVIHFTTPNEFVEYANYCVDQENKHAKEGNTVFATIFSRLALKCLKLSAICALLNPDSVNLTTLPSGNVKDFTLSIGQDDWEWAKKVCETELQGLNTLFSGTSGNEIDDCTDIVIMPAIVKLLKNKYANAKNRLPSEMIQNNTFDYSTLYQVVKQNSLLKCLPVYKGQTPLGSVLKHMESIGLIQAENRYKVLQEKEAQPYARKYRQSMCYSITGTFKARWNMLCNHSEYANVVNSTVRSILNETL